VRLSTRSKPIVPPRAGDEPEERDRRAVALAHGHVRGSVASLPGGDPVGRDLVVAREHVRRVGLCHLDERVGRRGAGGIDLEHAQVVEAAVAHDGEIARLSTEVDVVEQIDVVLAGVLVCVVDALDRLAGEVEDCEAAVLERPDDDAQRPVLRMHPDRRVVRIRVVAVVVEERLGLERRPDLDALPAGCAGRDRKHKRN
jgi:hypothetical protein